MIIERRSSARGHVEAGWLDSRHTFSFGGYYDAGWMGFGALRVINEDRVAPGAGFPPHRHANMEILSYVLGGELAHQDSSGGGGVIRAGELQWMSAGHGVEHSEFNASPTQPVHFLQIWLQPDRVNAEPAYAQLPASGGESGGASADASADMVPASWRLLASPDGADGSIAIRQDARLHGVRLANDATAEFALVAGRRYWLHVAQGAVEVNGRTFEAGDALGFIDEATTLRLVGRDTATADVLLFDLPG